MKNGHPCSLTFWSRHSVIHLLAFILSASIPLYFQYLLPVLEKPYIYITAAGIAVLEILLLLFFFFRFRIIFSSALFFILLFFSYPLISAQARIIRISFPGVLYLIPLCVYFFLLILFPAVRKKMTWLKSGTIDTLSAVLMGGLCLFSTVALYVWWKVTGPDISEIAAWFPEVGLLLIILGGFGFAVTNSIVEEFIFRGVLWEGFSLLLQKVAIVVFLQAMLFALWHWKGFPGDVWGVLLVFLWGIMLGILRLRTKGMSAPLIAHFASDLTIFFILLIQIRR
jgi:membrane protease YdiL (CAAX protease family)